MNVKTEYDQTLAAARALATKAEGRDFTDEELTVAQELQRKAFELEPKVKQYEEDAKVKAAIAELGAAIGIGPDTGKTEPATGRRVDTKDEPAKADPRPAWAVKRPARSEWVTKTVKHLQEVQSKALVSGSIDVPTPIFADITRIASYPTRLLDLLVDRANLSGTNTFSFLRQTVRTNNAAPVADNATKPTSVFTFAEVEDRVRVIAHLSEATPERYLSDHAEIGDFLRDEMEEGLFRALETQVVSGDGTGENLTGILNTSGIQVQAWSSDLLETTRKAATKLDVAGEVPNAWALHPNDVEVLDLLQDNEARMYWGGPQEQLKTAPVWSLPIVKSTAVPAGTGLLGDWNFVRLVVREDARFDIDRSGTLFTKNQFQARLEGRFGVAVRRPSAFCSVDLTAP